MPLWQRLYNTIWLLFFEFLLLQRWFDSWIVLVLHVVLGTAILVLTQLNARELAHKPVPDRLKRISRATANLAIAQAVLGLGLGGLMHANLDLPAFLPRVVDGLHLVLAVTMLAQASSTATGYDMWEEKELGPATPPPAPASTSTEAKQA